MTLKLNGSSSGSVSIDAPASTTGGADVALTLPVNDGDANQVLQTNGSGVLTWVTLPDNTPSWSAYKSADQNVSSGTWYDLVCDTEVWDTDSASDTSTGYFTVPSGKGGKYQINAAWTLDDPGSGDLGVITINRTPDGGSITEIHRVLQPTITGWNSTTFISAAVNLTALDVISIRFRQLDASGQHLQAGIENSWFSGFKLIGV